MELGNKIRTLRKSHNPKITQEELAEASGINRSVIAVIETGARAGVRLATVEKIAKGLGVDLARLFESDPDPVKRKSKKNRPSKNC